MLSSVSGSFTIYNLYNCHVQRLSIRTWVDSPLPAILWRFHTGTGAGSIPCAKAPMPCISASGLTLQPEPLLARRQVRRDGVSHAHGPDPLQVGAEVLRLVVALGEIFNDLA